MMAVILAGGKGTRLRPYSVAIPKPLMPLGDLPIVEVLLRQLKSAGVDRVVISIGHLAHLFSAVIGDGKRFGMGIEYVHEDEPLGTAGALRLVEETDKDFLVMNGDILTTLDFAALFAAHLRSKALATIAIHMRSVAIDYGVVETTDDGLLSRYIEKPVIPYKVSMGINVLARDSLSLIPPTGRFDMPQLMQSVRDSGAKVGCYETDCYWMDIGRIDDYQQASADFDQDAARFVPLAVR